MPTWCFKSALQRTRHTSTQRWYWQIDTQDTLLAITSKQLFSTLEECIADARAYGFRGDVEPSEGGDHPALISPFHAGEYHSKWWLEHGGSLGLFTTQRGRPNTLRHRV